MSKSPKFLNKNGTLTGHSFACGYIEVYKKITKGLQDQVEISSDSNCIYVTGLVNNVRIYRTFKKITEARKFARQYGKLDTKSLYQG